MKIMDVPEVAFQLVFGQGMESAMGPIASYTFQITWPKNNNDSQWK